MKTLKDIRTEAGLTQTELAKAMGLSQQTYSLTELGKRKMVYAQEYDGLCNSFNAKGISDEVVAEAYKATIKM